MEPFPLQDDPSELARLRLSTKQISISDMVDLAQKVNEIVEWINANESKLDNKADLEDRMNAISASLKGDTNK